MFRLFFRLLGLLLLALTVITGIMDLTRSIADSAIVVTALGEQWANLNTNSLQLLQVGIQRKLVIPWAWDLIFVPILQMPSWLVFGLLALMFLWLGRRTERRLRRRAI